MLPAGVILVFVLVFLAGCGIVGTIAAKQLKKKKSNQRF